MILPFWNPAVGRSVVWLGGAACLAYFKKPEGESFLAFRSDPIGWLGGGVFLAGLAFHAWSNLSLAWGERRRTEKGSGLVTDGPFRHVRNPIYLAGIMMSLGVSLIYSPWRAVDLVLPLVLLLIFHLRVVSAEEPALRRRFGQAYKDYCSRVPRWFPNL